MSLFWLEFQKIWSRKIVWLSLGMAGAFCCFWIWGATLGEADTVVEGVRYKGLEAIQKNREIARQWEGPLTVEKLFDIIDTYGLAVNEEPDKYSPRTGNWVSRYATDLLTDYRMKDEEADHSQVQYVKEEKEWIERNLESGNTFFCYMENLDYFYEMTFTVEFLVLIIIVLALAPVFSEEYQNRTAPVFLTCMKGHEKIVKAKVTASLVFAEGLYILTTAILCLYFFTIYGTDGLYAGGALSQWTVGYGNLCFWQIYLINFLWGLLGIFMMAALTLFFSARCRHTFAALAGGLACLAGGPVLRNVFSVMMPFGLLRLLCQIFGMFSPFYLTSVVAQGSGLFGWVRLPYCLAIIAACLIASKKDWKKSGMY